MKIQYLLLKFLYYNSHESASGYYRDSVYFLAKVFAEFLPYRAFSSIIFSTIVYWMVGKWYIINNVWLKVLSLYSLDWYYEKNQQTTPFLLVKLGKHKSEFLFMKEWNKLPERVTFLNSFNDFKRNYWTNLACKTN